MPVAMRGGGSKAKQSLLTWRLSLLRQQKSERSADSRCGVQKARLLFMRVNQPYGCFPYLHLIFVSPASEGERDEWSTAIRNAKAALLASLNVTHPNSTLSSSTSTNHLRKTLQALPHLPEDEQNRPRRGKVEHFVPAVWIPDGKTESCMRCGRPFGWRRRRHHCRLCGRCVCASCSGSVCWFQRVITGPTNITLRRSFTYVTQILKDLENLRALAMPAMKRFSRLSRPLGPPICLPRLELSHCQTFLPGSRRRLLRSLAHLHCSWPSTQVVRIVSSRA